MYRTLVGIFFLGALFFSSLSAAQISSQQELLIKMEIKELADNYGYYRDHFMADEYLTIWAEDAVAVDGDRRWQIGTSHIDIIDESHATGVHYATVYRATLEGPREQSEIIQMDGVYLVAKYMDEYLLTDDGWKISYRDIDRVFTSEN